MWKQTALVAVALGLATPAVARDYRLNFTPTTEQLSRYDRGTQLIDSQRQWATVRIVELPATDRRSASFQVLVLNSSSQSFVFGPANIVIHPTGAQPLQPITYEQAMEAERRRRGRERFWAGVAAFGRNMAAVGAGTTYGQGTYHGANGWGTFSYTAQNPAAQMQAQGQAHRMNQQARADIEAAWEARAASFDTLLRPTTVYPGAVFGGVASFTIPNELRRARGAVPVTIEVNVEGERHVFTGQLSVAR